MVQEVFGLVTLFADQQSRGCSSPAADAHCIRVAFVHRSSPTTLLRYCHIVNCRNTETTNHSVTTRISGMHVQESRATTNTGFCVSVSFPIIGVIRAPAVPTPAGSQRKRPAHTTRWPCPFNTTATAYIRSSTQPGNTASTSVPTRHNTPAVRAIPPARCSVDAASPAVMNSSWMTRK